MVNNQHVNRVTKKAKSMLRFVHRNLRQASKETKTQAYMSMVRSNIDYCSIQAGKFFKLSFDLHHKMNSEINKLLWQCSEILLVL